ncbi:MAG: DNA-processing protein DprA [Elusimicrobiota bacterium]|nr:MAG: DNA-processing protein DprA [Elusimicrobiota bacterium]
MNDLTSEKRALLLLCTRLALPTDGKPYTAKEFSTLVDSIGGDLHRFGKLINASADAIKSALNVPVEDASRMQVLLSGERLIDGEVERLGSSKIWALTREDEGYPQRYIDRLGKTAPWVLFGAGDVSILSRRGMAVVGSRNVDYHGSEFSRFLGAAAAKCDLVLCSGAARGVDQLSMRAAIEQRGKVSGVLADSLEKTVRSTDTQGLLEDGRLVLITPFSPNAPFSVGTAMGRNKLIYALADYGVVVQSDVETGGHGPGRRKRCVRTGRPCSSRSMRSSRRATGS